MATVYYVQADGGSDSNPGTLERPFKTIQRGVDQVQAGDTVFVRTGTYVEVVTVRRSGTAGAPITIKAYSGEQPIIDGRAGVDGLNSGLPSTGQLFGTNSRDGTGFRYTPLVSIEADYIVFEGIDITRSMGRGLRAWREGTPTREVTIRGCEISFSREAGLLLELGCNGVTIDQCDISRSSNFAPYLRSAAVLDHTGGLVIKGSQNISVSNTRVHENWGEGLIADAVTSGSHDVTVRNCEFYDNLQASIYLHAVQNVLLDANLLYRSNNPEFYSPGGGLAMSAAEPQFGQDVPTRNIVVANTMIVGFAHNIGFYASSSGRAIQQVSLKHNTLVNGGDVGILETEAVYQDCVMQNNLVFQSNGKPPVNAGGRFGGWTISHNAWSSTPPENVRGSGDVIGNLQLQNPEATRVRGQTDPTWYKIKSNSSAIGKALAAAAVERDYFGNRRDSQPDMGAHEFLTETAIQASFSASPSQGTAPLTVSFRDTSVSSQPITSWFWDFGDGSISQEQNPTHIYSSGGTYTVSLRVTSSVGSDISTRSGLIVVSAVETTAPPRVTEDLAVLYRFDEGTGSAVYDVSGVGAPLDLFISDLSATKWLSPGLAINSGTTIASTGPAQKLNDACRESNEITIEAWLKPKNTTQKGPARIVSVSKNIHSRNVTLGQGLWGTQPGDLYDVRLRTTERSANGMPSLSSPSGSLTLQESHVVFTRARNGRARIFVNGIIVVESTIPGEFSTWNPRFPLLIANETTGEYPWLGEIYLIAVYSRALTITEVRRNRDAGRPQQQAASPAAVSADMFKRFVIVSDGSPVSAMEILAFGVQFPDQRCVLCGSNGVNGMTIYEDVRKALDKYEAQDAGVRWLD